MRQLARAFALVPGVLSVDPPRTRAAPVAMDGGHDERKTTSPPSRTADIGSRSRA